MQRTYLLFAVLMTSAAAQAQISQGDAPYGWGGPDPARSSIPVIEMDPLDHDALENTAQLAERLDPRIARYGTQVPVNKDVLEEGRWEDLPDGRRICRLRLRSPGATMVSLQFDVFDLSPNVWMFIYDRERTFYIGGFTEANELPDGGLATAVIPGDEVVIEVIEPADVRGPSHLHVATLTHAFRDIFHFGHEGDTRDIDPGYQSAPCHNNIICPIASDWQTEKHASALFLRPNGDGCTGQLVNNTQTPGIPYFLIANHCIAGDPAEWVFYFNYESPTCSGTSGPTTQTISGATLVAGDYYDDFGLLQLSSAPPASYDPYYAGWDRSGTTPTSTTAILHPLFDVKKISFDDDPATSYSNGNTQLWRTYWDSGIIEPVASGSGLYDQNHRLIGHVVAGPQNCTNASTAPSGSVKLSESWDGASPSSRLRDWLDLSNAVTVLNGYDPNGTPPTGVSVSVRAMLEGPFDDGTGSMEDDLRAQGFVPLSEPYTALGYPHVGGGGESTTSAVLSVTGANAVTDWVVIELRDANDNASVVATRSALLLSNGNIVDVDGSSAVGFDLPPGNYHIAIRHRNHLGVMTQDPQTLSTVAVLRDFSDGSIALLGGSAATKDIGGTRCLYAGDTNRDGTLIYAGADNDRDLVLIAIGGEVPTNVLTGYLPEDLSMDGQVRYTGAYNDPDLILVNIGGSEITATFSDQLP